MKSKTPFASIAIVMVGALSAQSTAPQQKMFDTPDQAASALIKAAEAYDVAALLELFGPDGKDLISSGDDVRDRNYISAFAANAKVKTSVSIHPKNSARAILSIGTLGWPFPVPMVRQNGKWRFDSKSGIREILYRRIGSNELDAIQVCRGFVEAQKEYASLARDYTGTAQYAQRIISSPGKKDGLYWQDADGKPGGPISEVIAKAIEEGYAPSASSGYHGYYFKVLKGQGPAAPMGQLDYVINGIMIGGFALMSVPAEYGVSGVKTFIVSHDGIVYEKDLGPESLATAKTVERYNPDKSWHRTDDEWPAENGTSPDGAAGIPRQ